LKFIIELVYIGMKQVKSFNCLGRLLHEFLVHAPTIFLKILFYKANCFPLLDKLLQKIIPYLITEWKYGQKIDLRVLILLIWNN